MSRYTKRETAIADQGAFKPATLVCVTLTLANFFPSTE